jgi:threonylcarbamoyladenosine tRNA methylthiotransferase MtaB
LGIIPSAAVITIGCRLNQAEGDALRTLLQQHGNQVITKFCSQCTNSEKSEKNLFGAQTLNTCIINTCAVTERASSTSVKWIRRIASLSPKPRLVVTGCLAQTEPERLKRIEGVDEVFNQSDKAKLIENCPILPSRTRAFLKIQDGCWNRCTYCLPSRIRGAPISKPIPIVKQEVRELIEKGYQEIVLVGLNLSLYGMDSGTSLIALLENLIQIDGEFRIRLGSLEPDKIDDEMRSIGGDMLHQLIERFDEFRLCHHLHIPLQSGDDRILSLMRRKYTIARYQNLIEKIVCRIPDINIGTDLIIGFHWENDETFNKTLDLVKKFPFGYLHVFPYSPRPGTEAFSIRETVSHKEKKERVNTLCALSREKSLNFRRRFLNKVLPVIIEQRRWAMSDNYIRIFISLENNGKRTGRLAKALITDVTLDRTFGKLVQA